MGPIPRDLQPNAIDHFFAVMMGVAMALLVLLFIIIVRYEVRNASWIRRGLRAGNENWFILSYGTGMRVAHVDPDGVSVGDQEVTWAVE